MRTFSSSFRNELEATSSGEVLLLFMTITHPNLRDPILLVDDVMDYSWNGNTYVGFPLAEITLVSDDDNPPKATLSVPNIDRKIGIAAQNLSSSPRVQLDVLAGSDFGPPVDYVRVDGSIGKIRSVPVNGAAVAEYSAPLMRLRNVTGDASVVTGELWSWDLTQEPWPLIRTTQDRLPGLYR
jgi:hypothetical protein